MARSRSSSRKRSPPSDGSLARYREKRSADRTSEPFGGAKPGVGVGPKLFVIQKHDARRLHWDLRLEMDGVLRSWAVPRGPSLDPEEKRMAVETEDHPIEYVDFEGIIPEGNYGAGPMIVWDRGVYTAHIPMDEGYRDGKLLFELHGHKLRGVWTLVRTAGGDGKQWLLMKKPDGGSRLAGMAEPDERSVLSGLTIEELQHGLARVAEIRTQLQAAGAPRRSGPLHAIEPMLAQIGEEPFSREGWLFELKYDGYRVLAASEARRPELRYRSGFDATAAFPEVARTLAALPYERMVLDGEIVVLDDDARPNFQRLQKRALLLRARDVDRAMREHPVVLYAFDLLGFEDFDLRPLPLQQRKQLLRALLPSAGAIRFADHVHTEGLALWRQIEALGLEGIMAKRADAPYVGGRSPAWLKLRTEHTADFVVVGFTLPEGSRTGLRALHLAAFGEQGLTYVGRVGSGLGEDDLTTLRRLLDARVRAQVPCTGPVPPGKGFVWVEPELVVEVRFKHLTDEGLLRHPVFLRLRDDKPPSQCAMPRANDALAPEREPAEDPGDDAQARLQAAERELAEADAREAAALAAATAGAAAADTRRVVISNPDKLFWPADGYRKRDLVAFYREVSPWLLRYLRDRPLVLTRYPDGIDGKSFFQKNAPPYVPPWIRTKTMWSEHAEREIEYFVCDDADAIAYVANLATIPLHVWGSRLADLQHPDWCILDLDPKGAPFPHVVRIAREIEALCAAISLPAFLKTSGSTGLHVLMPLGRQCTFEQCKQLGEILATVVCRRLPDIATIERHVPSRRGRVYLDFVQNGHGRLLVAPLSLRPLPRAPVSTPLHWHELREDLDIHDFNLATVPARLATIGDPMQAVLELRPDLPAVLERLLPLAQ
ncbi:MAG: DNA ligase D [Nannocystaceae bacterium]|nr:DNA ligase D [Nannocystaceae bacterium]